MAVIFLYVVERHSGFAEASRHARALSLENAIGVLGAAVRSGRGGHDVVALDAHCFVRKVIFSGPVALGAPEAPVSLHARPQLSEKDRLASAMGLLADSARRALHDPGATLVNVHAVRAADSIIKSHLSYVRIEAGEFTMGSTRETGYGDEVRHRVRLTRPFMLKATALTRGDWFDLIGNNPSRSKNGPNSERASERPVGYVNWYDGLFYMNARSVLEGHRPVYDLSACRGTPGVDFCSPEVIPVDETADGYLYETEAQQEYTARAGTEGPTYAAALGKSLDDIAWTYRNSGGRTHPVGQKLPNAFRLYDKIGNTWDWGGDIYGPLAPTEHGNPVVDPRGADASAGVLRVFRGGGWNGVEHGARAANRNYTHPANRGDSLGLRPARSLFT